MLNLQKLVPSDGVATILHFSDFANCEIETLGFGKFCKIFQGFQISHFAKSEKCKSVATPSLGINGNYKWNLILWKSTKYKIQNLQLENCFRNL